MNTKITISNFRKHSSNRCISLRKPSISIDWKPSFVLIQVIRVGSNDVNHLCALDPSLYQAALAKFRSIHQKRFHARLDWSAAAEIVAIVFTFIAHVFSIILAIARVDWLVRLFFVGTMLSLSQVTEDNKRSFARPRELVFRSESRLRFLLDLACRLLFYMMFVLCMIGVWREQALPIVVCVGW